MNSSITKLTDGCQHIMNSGELRTMLQVCLQAGNYLNQGTFRGQAVAVDVGFLSQVRNCVPAMSCMRNVADDTRCAAVPFPQQLGSLRCAGGQSKTRNLLEFICAQLSKKSPDTLPGVVSVLGDHVTAAAAVDVEEIHNELLQLQQGMRAMSNHLSLSATVDGADESMLSAQVHFIDAARYDTLLAMSMTHRPIHRLFAFCH
jgi:hypothetical protein